MNKIVGRVAHRSACNRKENRIKRALNGAIIRGNGEGAIRAEERAKWTFARVGNGGAARNTVDVSGTVGRGGSGGDAWNYSDPSSLAVPLSPLVVTPLQTLRRTCGLVVSSHARANA